MPRLPTAEQLGQRPTPNLRGGISPLNLQTPRMGQEAQAEIEFGNAVKGVGDTLAVLARKEKANMDEARTEDDFSGYQGDLLELEWGEKEGFTKILGGDAVKRPLVEEYRARREAIAKRRRDSLSNEAQRIGFDKRVQVADRQFDIRLYRHAAEQSRVFQETTFEGVIATEQRAAALNWDQPGQIEMSLLRTDKEIERLARVKGITDKDWIDNQKLVAGSSIHTNVIDQMLVTGKDAAAVAYYRKIKEELTPDAIIKYGSKVDAASVDGEAIRHGDTVWGVLGPKSPNDPIRLDIMETWVRDSLKDKPKEMEATLKYLRSRASDYKYGAHEAISGYQADVLQAFHDGATLEQLQLMPSYQTLNGEDKAKMRDYVLDNGWTAQQRARAQAQYEEGAKSSRSYSTLWELSNPAVLSTLSEKQILALEPVLGQKNMGELMEAKRKLSSPEGVKAATIDDGLFNLAAHKAGLPAYEKDNSPEQKERLGRLKAEALGAIDLAQRGGKVMGYTEKEELINKIIDKQVLQDGWGTSTPSMPAAVVRPEERSQIYVPIDKVDSTWMEGAMNYIRSTDPSATQWDDAKIRLGMRGRLERAYAISISGGTAEEVKTALQGKDKGVRQ